jgi:regulator of replication initiation timing
MSDAHVTADEAEALLAGLARGRDEDGSGGDVWPLYERAEGLAQTVVALHAEVASLAAQRDALTRANVELAKASVDLRLERDQLREALAARYPRGKLTEGDEGVVQLAVGVVKDTVVVCFPKPVAWIGIDATTAEDIATKLRERAQEARAHATPPTEGGTAR